MQFGVAAYVIVRETEAEAKRELERITNVSAGLAGLRELPGLDLEHEARAAGEPAGLLGLEPRAARGPGRNAGAGGRADHRARVGAACRCCCCSAVRSSRRWSGLRRRSCRSLRRDGTRRRCNSRTQRWLLLAGATLLLEKPSGGSQPPEGFCSMQNQQAVSGAVQAVQYAASPMYPPRATRPGVSGSGVRLPSAASFTKTSVARCATAGSQPWDDPRDPPTRFFRPNPETESLMVAGRAGTDQSARNTCTGSTRVACRAGM